jgi:hypothetical protein
MLAISGKLDPTPPQRSCLTPFGEGTILITFRERKVDRRICGQGRTA